MAKKVAKKAAKSKSVKKTAKTKKSKKSSIKIQPKIKIVNVVASISVEAEIDLDKLAATLPNAEYEPEQFPGLVLRLDEPKSAILVFSSGKMVCTGTKDPRIITIAINKTVKLIRGTGTKIRGKPKIDIQNIVAASDLGIELNLDKVAFDLPNAEFEPEQFPGLVFRVDEPKVVFLLFRSGKIVCTGAKKKIDVKRGVDRLVLELKKIKAF